MEGREARSTCNFLNKRYGHLLLISMELKRRYKEFYPSHNCTEKVSKKKRRVNDKRYVTGTCPYRLLPTIRSRWVNALYALREYEMLVWWISLPPSFVESVNLLVSRATPVLVPASPSQVVWVFFLINSLPSTKVPDVSTRREAIRITESNKCSAVKCVKNLKSEHCIISV